MLRKTVDGYPYEEFKYCECQCGKTRSKHSKHYPYPEAKYIHGHHMKVRNQYRENNHMWKGGWINFRGYRVINDKLEHRLIYEQYHNCCLLSWGHVHHIDGNRLNNDISNLEAMTRSQHSLLEWQKRKEELLK